MFKNLVLFRIAPGDTHLELSVVEESLATCPFEPCGPTQELSIGWVPPRGEKHGALVEAVDGQWICRVMVETKAVPASAISRKLEERIESILQETGRKPGKKEVKELKDEIRLAMLPYAIPKLASCWVWIDSRAGALYIDASAQSRVDSVVTLLVELIPGLAVGQLATNTSPAAAMSSWLSTQEPPSSFSVDRECELKSPDESKSAVRYARHALDISEIQGHIKAGKVPTKLAMTWDDRVSFVLSDNLQVRKIAFLDTVFEGRDCDRGAFDSDVAIATGEMARLVPDLLGALRGEIAPAAP
ncbi:recombination-associated protein RdgC [Acidovorax sp.]|uniref:recombination-associated protein RdgC n=1 Tax=Acidovorax sp. TaxID=1872122 RepID=UPI0027B9023F|nr:recombination-associated protein RdgC [Acidovorax sp.]